MENGIDNRKANELKCRICLQQKQDLVQLPCSCLGEIGLVHEICFSQWINSIKNRNDEPHNQIQSLSHIQDHLYQIPCEICKTNIKLEILSRNKCIKLNDLRQPDRFIGLICVGFMTAFTFVISYFCISTAVNSQNEIGKKACLIAVPIFFFIVLGCLIKREAKKLMTSSIAGLNIVKVNRSSSQSTLVISVKPHPRGQDSIDFINPHQKRQESIPQNPANQ